MNIGERIKTIREFRGLTQYELGLAIGFDEKAARARISQYEINYRIPKDDMLFLIAKALKINICAIKNYALDSPIDVMEYLFWLDEKMGRKGVEFFKTALSNAEMKIHTTDHEKEKIGLYLTFDGLGDYLHEWYTQKEKLENGNIADREYFEWLINWPDTSE
jgi:transcriptional regulator with XRE-family HTH domain